ncbi:MAG: minor capsid protein [Novosphingobium sp.]|nr:minor capsid protein [Novosphingobium sp.]
MNVPSKDIQEMLEAEALEDSAFAAMLTTFPISRATFDEAKSDACRILDFSGWRPQLTMDRAKYERPTVQIAVKCVDYDEGYLFLSEVIDILHGKAHEVWNNSYYSLIQCMNGPSFIKRENQRTVFVANFRIQRREI